MTQPSPSPASLLSRIIADKRRWIAARERQRRCQTFNLPCGAANATFTGRSTRRRAP
ncbi:hypothetical protein [Edwardsiella piscicida]|uniref:hypothetical protein n=1 Tax=Edwardsiella piscicida TaxID=1263550 RepID=UPI0038558EE1